MFPDEVTARAVYLRVADRIGRGEAEPRVALPLAKDAFPKVLFLDQHIWIRLAKEHYERHDSGRAREALAAVRAAVSLGRIVVPMTATNVAETAEPHDEARRIRTATFMVDLSGNYSALHPTAVGLLETDRAIRVQILGATNAPAVRPALIQWGVNAAAMGHDPIVSLPDGRVDVVLDQALKEPEFSIGMLVSALDRSTLDRLRETDRDGVARVEDIRARTTDRNPASTRPAEMLGLLVSGRFADQFRAALSRHGVSTVEAMKWLSDETRLRQLADSIACVDVQATILHARDRNPRETTHANDFKDMSFLTQAIPYGNVVVTEKRWAHLANTAGLATKYGTTIIADVSLLPDVLRSEECL